MKSSITNALCIDVDDLFSALLESNYIDNDKNKRLPSFVDYELNALLEYFDQLSVKATFFIPGHFLTPYPSLVKEMHNRGHEVASHGMSHNFIKGIGRKNLLNELEESREKLEELIGDSVNTFKAPLWGIGPDTLWAYDFILEAGFKVDHTAMPSVKKALSVDEARIEPFYYKNELLIIPPVTISIFGKALPFCGGFYTAYIPYILQKKYFSALNQKGSAFNYYCHPFEVFPYLGKFQKLAYIKQTGLYPFLYSFHNGVYYRYLKNLTMDFKMGTLEETYREYIK